MLDLVAILHDVRSIHNVGSMFRTADGVGISKLYLTGFTPSPLDRLGKVREDFKKVSLGAEKFVKWEMAKATRPLIVRLKKEGYKVFAVEQSKKSIPLYRVAGRLSHVTKAAFIVGNEVKGLPASILKAVDHVIEIPMYGKKESLNVSVAFGIVAYALREA